MAPASNYSVSRSFICSCCSLCCWLIAWPVPGEGCSATSRHDGSERRDERTAERGEAGRRHQAHRSAAARSAVAFDRDRRLAGCAGDPVLHRDAGKGTGRAGPAVVTLMNAMNTREPHRPVKHRDVLVAFLCGGFVAGMVGLSFASVPFYSWFCRTTGYGGTTQVAKAAPKETSDRTITVRFDSNVSGGLPWRFVPERNTIEVK